jgi:hypothetical protein
MRIASIPTTFLLRHHHPAITVWPADGTWPNPRRHNTIRSIDALPTRF